MHLRRRTLFTAAAAAGATALAACASTPDQSRPAPQTAASREGQPSPTATSAPEATADESTESPTEEPASFEAIEEALGHQVPQEWGLDVSGVVTTFAAAASRAVLTLDACGGAQGSEYDELLIEVLRRTETPATLFINQRWAEANTSVTAELVADPLFEIANHGTRHLPLSVTGQSAYGIGGTQNLQQAYAEIVDNHDYFRDTYGLDLRLFRSGTAHVDEVSVKLAQMLGVAVVNYSVNADAGATFDASQVQQAMAATGGGDICIGHFNRPNSGTAPGVEAALRSAADRGLQWSTLGEVLG